MGNRKHSRGVHPVEVSAEKNARRYSVAAAAAAAAHRRAADLFPDVGEDPNTDGDQRFTLRETDHWCRAVAGVKEWDLDVAACAESHLAERYFTREMDGLRQPWSGRVWCNPPFSDIGPWVQKAWMECVVCPTIAMLLPASRTEQRWWQDHVEPCRDGRDGASRPVLTTHFLPSRTRFGIPGNPTGQGVGSPPFGCVLLVWKRP